MNINSNKKSGILMQSFISMLAVLLSAVVCFAFSNIIGYRSVAIILLMSVSILAMVLDIIPVLIAALLSALIWNFFFIPPLFTFHISTTEDVLMFLLYFVVALLNAVLTSKIRKEQNKVRDREEKENTIKLYNTLLNSLSHELRTPISTIVGAVDTLKDGKDNLSKSNQAELLNQIEIAGTRLNRQVENLLNMSRLETGMLKLNLDWCDVNELVHHAINRLEISDSHQIIFEQNDNLPLIKIDRGIIEQVIQNLLHNAINYTPKNSIISISVSVLSGKLMLNVSDNGKGISEEESKLIFDKFYRIPNTKTGGTGLGLSIVKGFVEAHQGKISYRNSKEGGACFVIEIPAAISYLNNLKNE